MKTTLDLRIQLNDRHEIGISEDQEGNIEMFFPEKLMYFTPSEADLLAKSILDYLETKDKFK